MGDCGYALALLCAIYHRERTGEGQWIDASQCESGIFLTGATILDRSANERTFRRYGNRSPHFEGSRAARRRGRHPTSGDRQ